MVPCARADTHAEDVVECHLHSRDPLPEEEFLLQPNGLIALEGVAQVLIEGCRVANGPNTGKRKLLTLKTGSPL